MFVIVFNSVQTQHNGASGAARPGSREPSRLRLGHAASIPRAKELAPLAGHSRSRVPPRGGAMLTLLRLRY
jgi:hypothetical protein